MTLDRLCTLAICAEAHDKGAMNEMELLGKGAYKADIVLNREDILNFELMC